MFSLFRKKRRFGTVATVRGIEYVLVNHLHEDFYLAYIKGACMPAQTYVVEVRA